MRASPRLRALLTVAAVVVSTAPARAQVAYRLKLQVGAEVDTNAERREENRNGGSTDGVTRFLLRTSLAHRPQPGTVIQARLSAGAKLFHRVASEDVFVTAGSLAFRQRLSRSVSLAVDATVKDRTERTSETAYFFGRGGASLDWRVRRWLRLRFRTGYGGFVFKPDGAFGYRGDQYELRFAAFPSRRLRLYGGYSFERRNFGSLILVPEPGGDPGSTEIGQELRRDQAHRLEVGVSWLRTILIDGSYTLEAVPSNSFGFSYVRHRFWVQLSARLPGRIYAHLAGALQLIDFRDPVYFDPTLFIDDDNRSWVSIKLSRRLGKGFAIEARYAFYASPFADQGLGYRRHVAGLGVAYSL